MTVINASPTVPAPGESSAGWPPRPSDQTSLAAQHTRNQTMWAAEIANATAALAALGVRSAALAARLAGDTDMIAAAEAQIAREVATQNGIIAACTAGTYSNIVATVYTLENATPMIGGGTF